MFDFFKKEKAPGAGKPLGFVVYYGRVRTDWDILFGVLSLASRFLRSLFLSLQLTLIEQVVVVSDSLLEGECRNLDRSDRVLGGEGDGHITISHRNRILAHADLRSAKGLKDGGEMAEGLILHGGQDFRFLTGNSVHFVPLS